MASITANQLKTKGVSALAPIIDEDKAVMITVRGENRYVVMDFETYNHLRECELEAALAEAKRELEQGEIFKDTVDEHIRRIRHEL
jgi:PHD/YefM family antitoxin component YafN of YafNO toxin-antitoxin module